MTYVSGNLLYPIQVLSPHSAPENQTNDEQHPQALSVGPLRATWSKR